MGIEGRSIEFQTVVERGRFSFNSSYVILMQSPFDLDVDVESRVGMNGMQC